MTEHLFSPVRLRTSYPAGEQTFTCFVCGKKVTLRKEGDVMADLKGPAYRAYYCLECYYKAGQDEKKSETKI